MFGLGEAMLGFLRRQVGLRTDAAGANGSLHAKVKTANDRIGANNPASGGTDTLFRYLRRIYDKSPIKSIQRGVTNLGTSSYVDVSISSVDTNKTVVNIPATSAAGATNANTSTIVSGVLSSSTQLRLERSVHENSYSYIPNLPNRSVAWEIIEYF